MTLLDKRGETVVAAFLALGLALVFMALSDVKPVYQVALYLGLAGVIALAVVPNQRLVLALFWILLHPLSVEKVFPIGVPMHAGFPPPTLIISASDVALYLLVGHVLLESLLLKRQPCKWPAAATPYMLLCLWVVLMFLVTPSIGGLLQILHWWKMLVFLLVLPCAIRTRGEFYLVLAALAFAIGAQSIIVWISWRIHRPISFISYFSPSSLPLIGFSFGGADDGVQIRASGTFGQVNQQAGLHLFFTLPLIGLAFVRNNAWRIFAIVVIALSMSAVLITYSRTAWVGAVVAFGTILAVAMVSGKMSRRVWSILALMAGLGCVVLGAFYQPVVNRIFRGDEGASSSRLRMILTSLRLTINHPMLGGGPGNFVEDTLGGRDLNRQSNIWLAAGEPRVIGAIEGLESYNGLINGKRIVVPLQVHNKYLLVLVELGIVGLMLFFWYQWRLFRTGWDCLKASDPPLFWVAVGLLGATVASQVYFMLELAYDDKSVLILILPNALLLCVHQIIRAERRLEVRT